MTPEHRQNHIKLAEYLENLPEDHEGFDMMSYINPCGTPACAAGHLPYALGLVNKSVNAKVLQTNLGPSLIESFSFLFGADWFELDNTPIGAANRIRHFLEHGCPEVDYNRDDYSRIDATKQYHEFMQERHGAES